MRRAYELCAIAVETQLGLDSDSAPAQPATPSTPPPSTPAPLPLDRRHASAPPPAPNASGYARRPGGNGRSQDGPPTTGKQLRQWASKNGTLPWFDDFARKQTPPLPNYYGDWSDEWAVFAHQTWLSTCIPPAGPVPNGRPSY